MTQTLRRVHKLLAGVDPPATGAYTASSVTALAGLYVTLGWANVGDVHKLAGNFFPLVIIDIPDNAESWDPNNNGISYRRMRVQFSLLTRGEGTRIASLYGTGSILDWYDKVHGVLYGSPSARLLTDVGVPWADESSVPQNMEDLISDEETGRQRTRLRRWEIEYRREEVDY